LELSRRQKQIVHIVKEKSPITSGDIAKKLGLSRAALRPDLSVLTMAQILDAKPKVGYTYKGKSEVRPWIEYIEGIKISDIMSQAVCVKENDTLYDTIVAMFLKDVDTLFVRNGAGYLAGVVSRKDILKCMMGGCDVNRVPIGIVMTRMPNVVTVFGDESILHAAKQIVKHQINSLPVVELVTDDGVDKLQIAGKISKTSIVQYLVKMSQE
jgi:CBS domain-containing protein